MTAVLDFLACTWVSYPFLPELSPALRFPHEIADALLGVSIFIRGNLCAVVEVFECRVTVQIRLFERERGSGAIEFDIRDFDAADKLVSRDIKAGGSRDTTVEGDEVKRRLTDSILLLRIRNIYGLLLLRGIRGGQ
jgi:hypothetical protein